MKSQEAQYDLILIVINQNSGMVSQWAEFQLSTPNLGQGTDTQPGARGFWMGGTRNPNTDTIDYVNISSPGNAIDFGNLTVGRTGVSCVASSTRGLCGGGFVNPANKNEIDFITVASTGNATDFGDLNTASRDGCGVSNSTRGLFFLARIAASPNLTNEIDQITIASTGNAVDFANKTNNAASMGSCESPTRGLAAGGQTPGNVNTIQFIIIASGGNAQDFGDLDLMPKKVEVEQEMQLEEFLQVVKLVQQQRIILNMLRLHQQEILQILEI